MGTAEAVAPKIRNKLRGLSRKANRTALNESSGEINVNYSETLLEGGNSVAQASTSEMGASGGSSLEFHELPRVAYGRHMAFKRSIAGADKLMDELLPLSGLNNPKL